MKTVPEYLLRLFLFGEWSKNNYHLLTLFNQELYFAMRDHGIDPKRYGYQE